MSLCTGVAFSASAIDSLREGWSGSGAGVSSGKPGWAKIATRARPPAAVKPRRAKVVLRIRSGRPSPAKLGNRSQASRRLWKLECTRSCIGTGSLLRKRLDRLPQVSIRSSVHVEGAASDVDDDVSVLVGPQGRDPVLREDGQRAWSRVAVRVFLTDGDHREPGPGAIEQCPQPSVVAAVVRDLEDVDWAR